MLLSFLKNIVFKMGKKDKKKKKGLGIEKTASKTEKKALAKQKKLLQKIGEVSLKIQPRVFVYNISIQYLMYLI